MLSDWLTFLGQESIGRALTLVGGAFAAIALAAWAVFKHFQARGERETTETVTLTLGEYRDWLLHEKTQVAESIGSSAQVAEIDNRLSNAEASRVATLAEIQDLEETLSKHDEAGEDYFGDARSAFRSGDLHSAEQILRKMQKEFKPVLERASDLYLGLAVISEQKADWTAAAKYYSRSAVLHETEENLIRSAIFLWRTGAVEEAYVISRKLLDVYRTKYGARDERVAGILNNLAAQLYDMGQVEEAKSTLLQALSIRDELRLPQDRDYAGAISNLGNIFLVEGDYLEAENLHRQAIKTLERLEDADESTLTAARNSLAEALRLQGKFEEAESILEENYKFTLERVGSEHPDAARALNFLAKLQFDVGKEEAGARNFMEALRVQRLTLGDYHPNSISIALGILHIKDTNPKIFEAWNLTEIETRYRSILDKYATEADGA